MVDDVGFLEIMTGDSVFCNRGPEFKERLENPLTVFSTRSDPDIEVTGRAGYTVNCHRVRADDEKLSVGINQRTDHFEEVSVKSGLRH